MLMHCFSMRIFLFMILNMNVTGDRFLRTLRQNGYIQMECPCFFGYKRNMKNTWPMCMIFTGGNSIYLYS